METKEMAFSSDDLWALSRHLVENKMTSLVEIFKKFLRSGLAFREVRHKKYLPASRQYQIAEKKFQEDLTEFEEALKKQGIKFTSMTESVSDLVTLSNQVKLFFCRHDN
jgi:hypothetical protein